MFTREDSPKQFSSDVPKLIVQRWFPRKTQICMIELLAAVVAVQTFREEIRGKLVLLFIDSEPVEAALIKGYSAKEDVCELVGLFWELVLELRCSVYIDRVPTDSNPADNPLQSSATDRRSLCPLEKQCCSIVSTILGTTLRGMGTRCRGQRTSHLEGCTNGLDAQASKGL